MTAVKYVVFAGLAMVLALACVHLGPSKDSQASNYQLTGVRVRSFDVEVRAVGTLDAARSHMVSSGIRGDKGKIIYLIKDGTRVNQGDVLVRLDPTPFEEEVHRLKGDVASLEAAVDASKQLLEWEKNQVEREIRTAEFNLRIARLDIRKLTEGEGPLQLTQLKEEMDKIKEEYDRYVSYISDLEALNRKGFDNPTEISLARKKAEELTEKYASARKKYTSFKDHVLPSMKETAKAGLEKAEMDLEQIEKGAVFKIAKAISAARETESKLDTAKTSLAQAETELKKTVITAPFSGITVHYETYRDGQNRKPRVGDIVLRNQPLLYLPDISSMIVKTRIREIDLHKIALGQACRVSVDAYPDLLFEGQVRFVGVLASKEIGNHTGEQYFQVTVALKEENPILRPGMTARIAIHTDRAENVLTVPIQAVFEEGGRQFCYRLEDAGLHRIDITAGRQNEDVVEILSGLDTGDRISLVKPSRQDMM